MRSGLPAMLIAITLALAACSGGSPAKPFTFGVASGDVTATGAVLWTRAERAGSVIAEVSADASFADGVMTFSGETSAERDFTVNVRATGLTPDTRYSYRFRARGAVSETGAFITPPDETTSTLLRFVFSGDSDGTRNNDGSPSVNAFGVLRTAAAEQPDLFLYFGDTIYADRGVPATMLDAYRAKYRENRGYEALTSILKQTSIVTMWDDHEVVNDFAGKTVDRAMFEAGRQAFQEYWPIDVNAAGGGHEPSVMYRSLRWGKDVELIVLDERSYRDGPAAAACTNDPLPAGAAADAPDALRGVRAIAQLSASVPAGCLDAINDPGRTMLGDAQKRFLFDRLKNSDATWKIIVNEVPIATLLAAPYDRWEGYAAERREILQFIRDNAVSNAVFLTTDFHANIFSPVRIDAFGDKGALAYEAIAGPIATATLQQEVVNVIGASSAGLFSTFLTGIAGVDCARIDAYSYGLVEVDPEARSLTITAKDESGGVLCKTRLEAAR